mmetsp:Transcript_124383/g.220387  ORF Transcript_124383/g.220387 Transcript_124383/m.220387 type:complete len:250 (-) Transcript_124383:107-856(-)
MPSKKRNEAKKDEGSIKAEPKKKPKIADDVIIDLDDEMTMIVPVQTQKAAKERQQKTKDEKKDKVKKENDDSKDKPAKGKERKKDKGKEKDKGQVEQSSRKEKAQAASKKRARSESSSDSSDSSSSSSADPYTKWKPYTKVQLRNLVRKHELNGATGQIIHPSVAVCPCPPNCLLVRLDTGREIAVKPPNLIMMASFHQAPPKVSQEQRLQHVLQRIRLNVDGVADGDAGSAAILDHSGGPAGGMGHFV